MDIEKLFNPGHCFLWPVHIEFGLSDGFCVPDLCWQHSWLICLFPLGGICSRRVERRLPHNTLPCSLVVKIKVILRQSTGVCTWHFLVWGPGLRSFGHWAKLSYRLVYAYISGHAHCWCCWLEHLQPVVGGGSSPMVSGSIMVASMAEEQCWCHDLGSGVPGNYCTVFCWSINVKVREQRPSHQWSGWDCCENIHSGTWLSPAFSGKVQWLRNPC